MRARGGTGARGRVRAGDADRAAPTEALPVKPVPRRAKTVMLSNERTLSRWAHPARLADIYSRHSAKSRRVARLRFFTEDGFPEVYLLVAQWTSADGDEWVKIRVPKRPNGKTGWVPRDALGPFNVVRTQLVVNRKTLRATLFKRGRKIWSARVGIGTPSTPTPAGRFWIREKFRFKNTPVYGTHALGTAAYAPNAQRLAQRRRRRAARHEPAGPDPGPPVARLHPHQERRTSRASGG